MDMNSRVKLRALDGRVYDDRQGNWVVKNVKSMNEQVENFF